MPSALTMRRSPRLLRLSLLIFAGIVSSFPTVIQDAIVNYSPSDLYTYLVYVLVGIATIVGVVVISEGQRNIPVNYAKQIRGNRSSGGAKSSLPLRLNMAGVIPIIFAISLIMFPSLVAQFFVNGTCRSGSIAQGVVSALSQDGWLYAVLYFSLVVGFTYFYTAVIFHPQKMAENLQRQSAFIPGIRPGSETTEYIGKTMSRLLLPGALFLGIIAVMPLVVNWFTGIQSLAIFGRGALQQVAGGTRLERVKNDSALLIHGEHETEHMGKTKLDARDELNAAHAGQIDVHQQHLGRVRGDFFERDFSPAVVRHALHLFHQGKVALQRGRERRVVFHHGKRDGHDSGGDGDLQFDECATLDAGLHTATSTQRGKPGLHVVDTIFFHAAQIVGQADAIISDGGGEDAIVVTHGQDDFRRLRLFGRQPQRHAGRAAGAGPAGQRGRVAQPGHASGPAARRRPAADSGVHELPVEGPGRAALGQHLAEAIDAELAWLVQHGGASVRKLERTSALLSGFKARMLISDNADDGKALMDTAAAARSELACAARRAGGRHLAAAA